MNSFASRPAAGRPRVRPSRCSTPTVPAALLGLHSLGQLGQDLVQVTDDPEVGEFEDRRVRVLVDRDDVLRALHADLVLDRARDAGREVQLRRDRLAGLADLRGVGVPAGIDDGARGGDRRVAAERRRELLGELEALGLAEPATAGDEDVGALDVDVGAALFAARDHRRLRGVRSELERRAARPRAAPPPVSFDLERVQAADDDADVRAVGLRRSRSRRGSDARRSARRPRRGRR